MLVGLVAGVVGLRQRGRSHGKGSASGGGVKNREGAGADGWGCGGERVEIFGGG